MKKLQLKSVLAERVANQLKGQELSWRHFQHCVSETTAVFAPGGSVIGILVKNAIPQSVLDEAYPMLSSVSGSLSNRASVIRKGAYMSRVRVDGLPSPRKTCQRPSWTLTVEVEISFSILTSRMQRSAVSRAGR
jgi:hypothetical protein